MAKPLPVTLGGYWINDYQQPALCSQPATKHCDDLVERFLGAMRSHGHQSKFLRRAGAASPRHWASGTDSDPGGVDTVDFAYLATHGATHGQARSNNVWVHWVIATFSSPDLQHKGDGCFFSTVVFSGVQNIRGTPDINKPPEAVMALGDGRLRWLVLDICGGLQVGLLNEEPKRDDETEAEAQDRIFQLREANPHDTWTRCAAGVHIIFGFTGLCSDSYWTRDRGQRFGERAGAGEPLADSWLDEAYSVWSDDAPVAVAWGRSGDDARRRLSAESLLHPEPTLTEHDIRGSYAVWRV